MYEKINTIGELRRLDLQTVENPWHLEVIKHHLDTYTDEDDAFKIDDDNLTCSISKYNSESDFVIDDLDAGTNVSYGGALDPDFWWDEEWNTISLELEEFDNRVDAALSTEWCIPCNNREAGVFSDDDGQFVAIYDKGDITTAENITEDQYNHLSQYNEIHFHHIQEQIA